MSVPRGQLVAQDQGKSAAMAAIAAKLLPAG
jgi:hypothetical protein